MLIKKCVCGKETFKRYKIHNIDVNVCDCGMMHQYVDMTEEELINFYKTEYHTTYQDKKNVVRYSDRYDNDYKVAELRFNEYKKYILNTTKFLDVGAGNGAFVDYLRNNDYSSYGIDLSENVKNKFIYNKPIDKIKFPFKFDFITVHDVLEHVTDPVKFLNDIASKLNNGGICVIDVPDFWNEAGKHHWKVIEHLWFWSENELADLFKKAGFSVLCVTKPIPGKLVFYLSY